MLKHPKKFLALSQVSPLVLLIFFYSISILLESNFWGNLLSSLIAFTTSLLILLSIKKTNHYKPYFNLLFFCFLSWALADSLWFIYEHILLINPELINYINIIYLLPNIFFSVVLSLYILEIQINWNLQQLFIDILTFAAMSIVLLSSVFFSTTEVPLTYDFEHILILIYIFLDFLVIFEIGLIIFTKRFEKQNLSFNFIFVGIVLYTLADFYFAYLSLINAYEVNSFVDFIYILCEVFIAFGITIETIHPTTIKKLPCNELYENTRKPKKSALIISLTFYLGYLLNLINIDTLIKEIIICIIYWVLTTNARANMLDKLMLKSEIEMNEQLENLIVERTKELSLANQHLKEISNTDALTGLYNRRYLINYLNFLTTKHDESFALLYIDANRFKPINDSYGHEIGDKVLLVLSKRFLELSTPNYKAFRIGGDEFAIIIEQYKNISEVSSVAKEILEVLQVPISIPPYYFTLTASIGIAQYPTDAQEKDVLMRYADIAMYQVKSSSHKNNYIFFEEDFIKKINKKDEIEFFLHNADYNKEFMLYYQPQYNAHNRCLIGMEALVRWNHPEKGLIAPSDFIPIAEENGMIINIGDWVIDKAFSQIKNWNLNYEKNLRMSINISPIQIKDPLFLEKFLKKIEKENIDPKWIDLEITESVAMISSTSIERIFDILNDTGINISIDDFGTGYSSLSYIRKYNIDRLKIAKELIDNIHTDENARIIVKAIIMMAKGMKLKTISEGVEDDLQLEILKSLECDEIQGYIFGKPIPQNEFEHQFLLDK